MNRKTVPEWLSARLYALRTQAVDAESILESAIYRLRELHEQHQQAEYKLNVLERPHPKDSPERKNHLNELAHERTETLNKLAEQIEVQGEYVQRAREHFHDIKRVHEACDQWLSAEQRSGAVFERVTVQPRKGDAVENLAKVREWLEAIDAEIEDIWNRPPARADMQAAARQFLDEMWAKGEPQIEWTGKKFELRWQGRLSPTSVLSLMYWLHGDLVEQRIQSLIDVIPVAADAMTLEAKIKKRDELGAKRTELLYEEDSILQQLVGADQPPRRKEVRPEHVLGCRVVSHVAPVTLPSKVVAAAQEAATA